ncbi:MAG: hypothetical protein WBI29_01210 [Candidatus Saccharimonadales bacterium]
MNKKILLRSLLSTFLAAVYIFLVSQIINSGDRLFGQIDNAIAPFVFLLLFSLSAAVVGGLVFGESLLLLIKGKYSQGIISAVYSVAWLGLYTFLGLLVMFIFGH